MTTTKWIIKQGNVRQIVSEDLNISPEYYLRLNEEVLNLIKKTEKRAFENHRATLYARDL